MNADEEFPVLGVDYVHFVVGNAKQGKGGEQSFAPTYACLPPGVHHGPFTSRNGCILHEIHYYETSGRAEKGK